MSLCVRSVSACVRLCPTVSVCVRLFVCPSVRLSVFPSVRLSVCPPLGVLHDANQLQLGEKAVRPLPALTPQGRWLGSGAEVSWPPPRAPTGGCRTRPGLAPARLGLARGSAGIGLDWLAGRRVPSESSGGAADLRSEAPCELDSARVVNPCSRDVGRERRQRPAHGTAASATPTPFAVVGADDQ